MCGTEQVLQSRLQHRALFPFQCNSAPTSLRHILCHHVRAPAYLSISPPAAAGGCAMLRSHALENNSWKRPPCHQPKEWGCCKSATQDTRGTSGHVRSQRLTVAHRLDVVYRRTNERNRAASGPVMTCRRGNRSQVFGPHWLWKRGATCYAWPW